jgi:hypothetical protein
VTGFGPESLKELGQYNEAVVLFRDETDRGAAIVGATYVQEFLGRVLRKRLVPGPATNQLLRRMAQRLEARILLCSALGIIDDDEITSDLKLISDIRNQFAHNLPKASFADPEVKELCAKLRLVERLPNPSGLEIKQDARERFLFSLGIATLLIAQRALGGEAQEGERDEAAET